jgi:hypothetical protein
MKFKVKTGRRKEGFIFVALFSFKRLLEMICNPFPLLLGDTELHAHLY